MIGLDANVLVHYLAQDDPVQSAKATRIFEQQLSHAEPGFISIVTVVETVWVLERIYGLSSQEIARNLEQMRQAETLMIQNEQQVFTAMVALKAGAASFADALIGALGSWAGCNVTITFDRKAARLRSLQLA